MGIIDYVVDWQHYRSEAERLLTDNTQQIAKIAGKTNNMILVLVFAVAINVILTVALSFYIKHCFAKTCLECNFR